MTALLVSNLVLWVVVLGLLFALLAAIRQIGVLHERIAPTGALMLTKGLKAGELAPQVTVQDLQGTQRLVGAPHPTGRATLILFVSPTCPVCKALLPVLKSSRHSESDWLDFLLASDGDLQSAQDFISAQRLQSFPYILSTPLGLTYQVSRLPFAVLVDADGILRARGIVNSREHLESLLEAKRLGLASIQDYFQSASRNEAAQEPSL